MYYLRNLGRRKVRTALTILGITIGIWALVVFGSMANKINALVAGGSTYYADKITLSDGSGALGGFSSAPMSLKTADLVRNVDGVDVVVPAVMMLMDDQASAVTMGVPPMITGSVPGSDQGRETFVTTAAEGRKITTADANTNVTVLGSDIARKYDKHPGDTIVLKGEPFTVIGVLEPTLTAPDQAASIPMGFAQRLLVKSLPPMLQYKVTANGHRDLDGGLPDPGPGHRDARNADQGAGPGRRDHDRQGLRQADRQRDVDPQLDPRGHRPHQPPRRRPVGHQHDGHVDRRTDPRDRDQARHRRESRRGSSVSSWSRPV